MKESNRSVRFYIPLSDGLITLEPLTATHIQHMRALSGDSDIWTWYTADLTEPDALESWMTDRLNESNAGQMMAYAVIYKDEVIGATSYGHINWTEGCFEIGWTWLGKSYIGTGLNKRMKYLMLRHAFDQMNAERVELRTDERNARSRRAMEKIGAKLDGVLRNHRRTQDGRRNTVIYSIIKSEWPAISKSVFSDA